MIHPVYVYTGCVIKIQTNFNLNFPPHCASANVTFGDWVSLMLLVNSLKLKMVAASIPGGEYNRRAAIIEGLRAGQSPTEISRYFGYPRPFMTLWQNIVLQNNQTKVEAARKSHSKECTARTPAVVERTQALILEDPGQSLRKLASIVSECSEAVETVASGRPYVFQQDGAPAHTNHLVQNWLSDNIDIFWSKEFWPSNSSDLNPLDYYVWSVVERVANKSRHPNVTSLRITIEATFADIHSAIQRACERFKSRIEAVIEVDGGYIE